MPIKTFRGLLDNGQQERIRLQSIDGKKGYRIKKLEIIAENPQTQGNESVIKVFTIEQTASTADINFSEQTLLAAGFLTSDHGASQMFKDIVVVDSMVFSQDIFITHNDQQGNKCNFYMELEQISLDDVEATAVILKSFRNTNTV